MFCKYRRKIIYKYSKTDDHRKIIVVRSSSDLDHFVPFAEQFKKLIKSKDHVECRSEFLQISRKSLGKFKYKTSKKENDRKM